MPVCSESEFKSRVMSIGAAVTYRLRHLFCRDFPFARGRWADVAKAATVIYEKFPKRCWNQL